MHADFGLDEFVGVGSAGASRRMLTCVQRVCCVLTMELLRMAQAGLEGFETVD